MEIADGAVFFLEDQVWPSGCWTPAWQDLDNRGKGVQQVRLSSMIPLFIRSEVVKMFEELYEIDCCTVNEYITFTAFTKPQEHLQFWNSLYSIQ